MGYFSSFLNFIFWPFRILFSLIARLIPGLSKLGRLSLPWRFAILTFVLLLMLGVVGFIRAWLDAYQEGATLDDWLSNLWVLIPVNIITPIVVFLLTRVILEPTSSRFPDVDRDWKHGLSVLRENGLLINEIPLYLVLGTANHEQAASLMGASRLPVNVKGVPEGQGALHWYGNEDAIFLFLTGTCCLSRLAQISQESRNLSSSPQFVPRQQAAAVPRGGTIQIPTSGGAGAFQTMQGLPGQNATMTPESMQAGSGPAGMAGGGMPGPGGTLDARSLGDLQQQLSAVSGSTEKVEWTKEAHEYGARFEYLCGLIRRARTPVVPVNGLLLCMPFSLVKNQGDQLQAAIQRDYQTIRDRLLVRCPATVLVTSMEEEAGFQELVRRVGEEKARDYRFGKGFNVWNEPIAEQLSAVGQHACGAFEDWIYMLFNERDGLRRPGNTKLFSLLCKIRGGVADSLAQVLANGLGVSPDKRSELLDRQPLFAGCYFAATGPSDDRQAFVKSALAKMMANEAELDWTDKALDLDDRYSFMANIAAAIGGVSLLVLGFVIAQEMGWIPQVSWLEWLPGQ